MTRKVRSTDEALALHERYRAHLLFAGRCIAVSQAKLEKSTHTRKVRAEMIRLGYIVDLPPDEAQERWLGALFRPYAIWEWTGDRAPRDSEDRNTHKGAEGVKVWRLREGADTSPWTVLPPVKEAPPPISPDPYSPPFDSSECLKVLAHFQRLATLSGERWGDNMERLQKWLALQ